MSNLDRYIRQVTLNGFGAENQQKLLNAKVLIIGAGGLGCPMLQYLTAAGVGTLGVIDFDKVELSNLHRQILFDENSIGKYKAQTAADKLKQLNSQITFNVYNEPLTQEKALEIFPEYDLIADGSDNFQTRYLVNDACILVNKPLVYAAIYQYEGQVAIFNAEDSEGKKCNYRDLFPTPPAPNEIPNCNEAGVLGILPGIIGNFQANEIIKFICGLGEPLINKILTYNILNHSSHIFSFHKNPQAKYPESKKEYLETDYNLFCNGFILHELESFDEIKIKVDQPNTLLVDVRNEKETPKIEKLNYKNIPLDNLYDYLDELNKYKQIIFICQTGSRSLQAIQIIKHNLPNLRTYNVKGGITHIQL